MYEPYSEGTLHSEPEGSKWRKAQSLCVNIGYMVIGLNVLECLGSYNWFCKGCIEKLIGFAKVALRS